MICASKPGRSESNCPISATAKTHLRLSEVERSSIGLAVTTPTQSQTNARSHFGIANLRHGMRYFRVRAVTAASPETEPHNFNSRTDKFYET